MSDVFVGEQSFDIIAPVIGAQYPAPDAVDVGQYTNVYFEVTDDVGGLGVDTSTLAVTIAGQAAVTNGAAVGDTQTLTITAIANGYSVDIELDGAFDLYQLVAVAVTVDDLAGNQAVDSWSFRVTEGVIEAPKLSAVVIEKSVELTWTIGFPALIEEWQLRRKLGSIPPGVDDGDLLYSGLDRSYTDLEVEYGSAYSYSIFLLRRYGVYAPYGPESSANARILVPGPEELVEYKPAPGEIGLTTSPVPDGETVAIWGSDTEFGDRRSSDEIRCRSGSMIVSPFTGKVRSVDVSLLSGIGKKVEIVNDSGIIICLDPVRTSVGVGDAVNRRQLIGRSVGGSVEFSAFKRTGSGKLSIRPVYIYSPPRS